MKTTTTYVMLALCVLAFSTASVAAEEAPTCELDIETLPVSCDGGDIIFDGTAGDCRTIICETDFDMYNDHLQVLACDKGDYFEMYGQVSWLDTLSITLGDTTLVPSYGGGFARSENVGLLAGISPWFPQGNHVELWFDGVNFAAQSFDVWFGDGHKQLGYGADKVYHVYDAPGSYPVVVDGYDVNGNYCHAELTVTVDGE